MYDHVEGLVTDKEPARVVIRAHGVGFEFKVPVATSAGLLVGQAALLYTILHVVDGNPSLLGFASRAERELARRLLSVSGVGPAICLAILSMYPPAQIASAIQGGDHQLLRRVKGVGTKTAERLCLELRDHLDDLDLEGRAAARIVVPRTHEDALRALITLGYSEKEAREKLAKAAAARPDAATEELIKTVLRS